MHNLQKYLNANLKPYEVLLQERLDGDKEIDGIYRNNELYISLRISKYWNTITIEDIKDKSTTVKDWEYKVGKSRRHKWLWTKTVYYIAKYCLDNKKELHFVPVGKWWKYWTTLSKTINELKKRSSIISLQWEELQQFTEEVWEYIQKSAY